MKSIFLVFVCVAVTSGISHAQTPSNQTGPTPSPGASATPLTATAPPTGVALPPGYVIGPEDVLTIVFWRDKDLSGDVQVRPDGKISVPLLNDISAAGLTPDELRTKLSEAAAKFVQEPTPTVVVKEIHSRHVFITGNVAKPGSIPLNGEMTVLQLIAASGGLLEYADAKNIVIIRTENGRQKHMKFNYKDVIKQKKPEQNVVLKPGDTVVVP
jgi:polysaccharide biosynthesis/export protein